MSAPAPRGGRSPRSIAAVALAALGVCALGALLLALPWLLRTPVPGAGTPTPAGAWEALDRVVDPELGTSVVELGLVREVKSLPGGGLEAVILLTSPTCPYRDLIVSEVRRALEGLPGAGPVRVTVDRRALWTPELAAPGLRERLVPGSPPRR